MLEIFVNGEEKPGQIQVYFSKHKDNKMYYANYNALTNSTHFKEITEELFKALEDFLIEIGFKLITKE